ncbi:LysE family translocator [Desulfofustis limnaeus]|jgi:threonine/homoserine/homoserine lactone efflux protein|uniref:Lysine transporter LysE n=1 Tax=Desulfofustis limnaeus TaxID=2740163 RepID=A0ABN6MA66_9BACT|nr:LysE family translocator [Desulfofustis limnaeus]MDX9894224.1 LysE family translocator [Desulfofustis sp.]BDD88244.1 lysine transporter LysE [Desulfofustis limnaeus]
MNTELWIAYLLATTLILVIPGPTIILVISQAVAHGRRSVIPLAAGVVCGDLAAMTGSLLGLGAIMSASATLFMICKWIGALYLFYLGITLWRPAPKGCEDPATATPAPTHSLFRRSFVVTALNPKSIAFFVAFLPQFVDRHLPMLPQLLLLGGSFLVLALLNALLYALFASQLREFITQPPVRRWFERCGGTALIGAGIFTAGMQRTS